jgi:hypothetical protein
MNFKAGLRTRFGPRFDKIVAVHIGFDKVACAVQICHGTAKLRFTGSGVALKLVALC